MIQLTCTKCQAVLDIDDAFAGGVCRCQHCGTIQTVPSQRRQPRPAAPTAAGAARSAGGSKSLYQTSSRPSTRGGALDELADVVASSGLTGSGLGSPRLPPRTVPQNIPASGLSQQAKLLLASAAGAITILLILVIVLIGRSGSPVPPPVAPSSPAPAALPPASFCGTPLTESRIVYLLDRGSASARYFDDLKLVCLRSIATLTEQRHFRVIFWNNGNDAAYPESGFAAATPNNLLACQQVMADITAHGETRIDRALQQAIADRPDAIILITGKNFLGDDFVKTVLAIRGSARIPIHTIALEPSSARALKSISSRTSGQYADVSESELHDFAK